MLTTNEHNYDRIARVVIAVALFALALSTSQLLWAVPGLILLGTAMVGFCPIYRVLGISTCKVPQQK